MSLTVVTLSGAIFGASIIYIMPALLLLSLPEEESGVKTGVSRKGRTKFEGWLARGTVGVGVVLAVLGAAVALLKEFTSVL